MRGAVLAALVESLLCCWGWRHHSTVVHAHPHLLCSGLSCKLLSRQECLPVYKRTVRADGFLGLSKVAVKAQDRIRKAVNTRSQSWNTASPVPTATIEEFYPPQHIYPLYRVFHLTGCLICRLWFLPTFHWINRQRGSVREQSRQDLLGNLSLSSVCFPTSAWQWKVFLLLSLQPLKVSACVSLRVEGREEAQVGDGPARGFDVWLKEGRFHVISLNLWQASQFSSGWLKAALLSCIRFLVRFWGVLPRLVQDDWLATGVCKRCPSETNLRLRRHEEACAGPQLCRGSTGFKARHKSPNIQLCPLPSL